MRRPEHEGDIVQGNDHWVWVGRAVVQTVSGREIHLVRRIRSDYGEDSVSISTSGSGPGEPGTLTISVHDIPWLVSVLGALPDPPEFAEAVVAGVRARHEAQLRHRIAARERKEQGNG